MEECQSLPVAWQTAGYVCGEGGSLITVSSTFCSKKGGGVVQKEQQRQSERGEERTEGKEGIKKFS